MHKQTNKQTNKQTFNENSLVDNLAPTDHGLFPLIKFRAIAIDFDHRNHVTYFSYKYIHIFSLWKYYEFKYIQL